MIFWGWGRKNKSWTIGEGLLLMVTWSYFDIFFMPIAFNKQWHILSNNRDEDKVISYEDVKKLIPDNTPTIGYFYEYGLLIAVGILTVFITISNLFA